MRIDSDELQLATRWYYGLSRDKAQAIRKAMISCDKLGVDGNQVLIASYRLYNRMMANSVPSK